MSINDKQQRTICHESEESLNYRAPGGRLELAPDISLPDISLRQLDYLVAVADAPTWATAAERVGVSPSALSQGSGRARTAGRGRLVRTRGSTTGAACRGAARARSRPAGRLADPTISSTGPSGSGSARSGSVRRRDGRCRRRRPLSRRASPVPSRTPRRRPDAVGRSVGRPPRRPAQRCARPRRLRRPARLAVRHRDRTVLDEPIVVVRAASAPRSAIRRPGARGSLFPADSHTRHSRSCASSPSVGAPLDSRRREPPGRRAPRDGRARTRLDRPAGAAAGVTGPRRADRPSSIATSCSPAAPARSATRQPTTSPRCSAPPDVSVSG